MSKLIKRRRGAKPGNQNARKHGYYADAMDENYKLNLKQAARVVGLDQEIDMLRASIKAVVQSKPENLRVISQAVATLARLVRARDKLAGSNGGRLQKAVENFYYTDGVPDGIGDLYKKTLDKSLRGDE